MDQLKTQLAAIKQHSFWVMAGGILLVTLGSWWYSTGKLRAQKESGLSAIKTSFENVNQIRTAQPQHPNASTAAGMDDQIKKYAQEVLKGWELQYDQQKDVLVWPESFAKSGFLAAVDKLRPIEMIPPPPTPIHLDLSTDYRDEYRTFIEPELPRLAETIGTFWRASSFGADTGSPLGAGAMPVPGAGTAGVPPAPTYDASGQPIAVADTSVVLWDPANQQEILMTHFGFTAPGRVQVPSTLEVLYAQEDLWVLQIIMDIIKATNEGATARHEATIKQLDYVRIGRSAMGLAGMITPLAPGPAGGMPGSTGMPGSEGTAAPAGAPGAPATGSPDGTAGAMPGGEGGSMTAMLSRDPAEGRYVDEKYVTLPATRLRSALTSKTAEDALLAVAKRMPVRIRVKVDQRKLNVLLAACGNSRLPVEVRQVRINKEPAPMGGAYGGSSYAGSSSFSSGSGMPGFSTGSSDGYSGTAGLSGGFGTPGGGFGGGTAGGFMPTPGSYSGEGGGAGYAGGRPGMVPGSHTADASVDLNLIDVELYGIVYIYNPVNKAQLGLEEGAAPPAAPTAGTPAEGTPPAAAQTPATPAPNTVSTTVPPAAVVP
jgi:hypothetical protein